MQAPDTDGQHVMAHVPAEGPAATPTATETPAVLHTTYQQIVRSSAIIGGASGINMLLGFVRVKAMALLLGPQGVGLMAAFVALADVARTVASMGVNHSGVRQIAAAASKDENPNVTQDTHGVASDAVRRTAQVLRYVTLACSALGCTAMALLAPALSRFTFGHAGHADAIALLAVAVFLRLVGDSQGALLQGLRRVGDVAKVTIWGGLLGTAVTVPLIMALGTSGIVPSLVAMAALSLAVSWWTSRQALREPMPHVATPASSHTRASVHPPSPWTDEAKALLRMGVAFMLSGVATLGAAYAVRLLLIQHAGLAQAGLYQAAWGVGTLLVGFVLQSMSTDFYPRLVAAAHDHDTCNRLVNEQTLAGLLLAGVGALGTSVLAPWVVPLLYSSDFTPAVDVLRWVCLGVAMRVVTWPLGYILVAKGQQVLFVGVDVVWAAINVGLTYGLVSRLGLVGAGMAFFLAYVVHLVLVLALARRLTGFRWSPVTARTALVLLALMGVTQAAFHALPLPVATALGLLTLIGFSLHAVTALTVLLGGANHKLARLVLRCAALLRRMPWGRPWHTPAKAAAQAAAQERRA
jgi:enterobacterial common antigen flippase